MASRRGATDRHSHQTKPPQRAPQAQVRLSHATCPDCGKQIYASRDEAKKAAKILYPGEKKRAYPCPLSGTERWHFHSMSASKTERWREYEFETPTHQPLPPGRPFVLGR